MSRHKKYKIPVSEYTTPMPVTVLPSETIARIMEIMAEGGFRHLPVMDGNKPVGIISERDVRLLTQHAANPNLTAQDIMTPGPHTITPDLPLDKAAFDLSKYKIGSALVVDSAGDLVGIFTSTDALNALIEVVRGEIED
jgi:acetoin utilization protein AcuB